MYLKITNDDGTSYHGGSGAWPLPTVAGDGTVTPGEWWDLDTGKTPRKLVACEHGLHLFEPSAIVSWIGPALWEAEHEGEIVHDTNKVVVRKARLLSRIGTWNAKTLSLWAADCAEHQLGNFETRYPEDRRPRQAIEAVRGFAEGTITLDELEAARSAARSAWSAAEAAAWSAAEAAAWSAWSAAEAAVWSAWSARSARSARSAVRSAVWSARSAVWSARSAARSAEADWQTASLLGRLGLAVPA